MRVAQIIPYFGKWPEWMQLYLYSCSRNRMIDFIFFTDCESLSPCRENDICNVRYHRMSFEQYKDLVSDRLGYSYCPSSPYKLTDLKPFLGLIHKDILADYDWWGFGDIDLVYGDMSMLINEQNLKRFSLITTHNYHIAGHCTFMRNNEYYRNLCMNIDDWQARLNDEKHYGFDEAEWSSLVYPAIKWPLGLHRRLLRYIPGIGFYEFMDKANRIFNSKELFKEFYTSMAPQSGQKWIYDVNSNRIFSPDNRELPYLHLLFFKNTPWFQTDNYWRPGFYQLTESPLNYNKIYFDNEKVYGEK